MEIHKRDERQQRFADDSTVGNDHTSDAIGSVTGEKVDSFLGGFDDAHASRQGDFLRSRGLGGISSSATPVGSRNDSDDMDAPIEEVCENLRGNVGCTEEDDFARRRRGCQQRSDSAYFNLMTRGSAGLRALSSPS